MSRNAKQKPDKVTVVDSSEPVPTQTIARAVAILTILHEGMHGVTAIAKRLGLSKATIHRLLKSLEMTGLVMRDPDSRQYCLGPLVVSLASDYLNAHQNLCILARKEMQHLWELSGETVSLLIQAGIYGMYLEEYISPQLIRYIGGKGTIIPLHAGSGGKVILSQLSDSEVKTILKNLAFETGGANTILDRKTLLKEIAKARKQGYATSFHERTIGGAAISVPIKNYIYPVALSIIGPDTRLAPKMMGLLQEMRSSAERISKKLLALYNPKLAPAPVSQDEYQDED